MDDVRGLDYFLGKLDTFRTLYDYEGAASNNTKAVANRLVGDADNAIFLLEGIRRTAESLAKDIQRAKDQAEVRKLMEYRKRHPEG